MRGKPTPPGCMPGMRNYLLEVITKKADVAFNSQLHAFNSQQFIELKIGIIMLCKSYRQSSPIGNGIFTLPTVDEEEGITIFTLMY